MIDRAVMRPTGGTAAGTRAVTPPLPRTLEPRQIHAGIRTMRRGVRGCFDRYRVPGQVDMRMTIRPAGRVDVVRAKGVFAGTPTGACLEAVFRAGRFAPFAGPPLTITFPVILR